jgi:hypothetical protein
MFQGVLSSAHAYVHTKTLGLASSPAEFHQGTHSTDISRSPGVPAHNNQDDEANCSVCLALLMGGTFVPAQPPVLAAFHAAESIATFFAAPVVTIKTRYSPAHPQAPPQFG